MNIAFMGAPHTGKSTTVRELSKVMVENNYILEDQYRKISQELGYSHPLEILQEKSSYKYSQCQGLLLSNALGAFSILEQNHGLYSLIDVDPITYYAFFLFWFDRENVDRDVKEVPPSFIKKMVDLYIKKMDMIIYFPIHKLKFNKGRFHRGSEEFQIEIDKIIQNCIKEFNVTNLIELKSVSVVDRTQEIIEYLN
jgi:hypothetical protein